MKKVHQIRNLLCGKSFLIVFALFGVIFFTLKAPGVALFLGGILSLLPLCYRKIFSFESFIFILTLSLILEKYSYYVGFSIRLPMLLIIGTAIGWILHGLLGEGFRVKKTQFNLLFAVLILSHLLGTIWAHNPDRVLRVSFMYLFLIALFFIAFYSLHSEKRIKWAIDSFILVGILGSAYGIYQVLAFIVGLPWQLPYIDFLKHSNIYNTNLSVFRLGDIVVPRINSTFNDPVLIGTFSGMSLMLLLAKFGYSYSIRQLSTKRIILFAGACSVLFICVLLTFSRSAWLGLIAGTMVLSYYFSKRTITRKLLVRALLASISVCIGIIAVYPPMADYFIERVLQTFDSSNFSTAGHLKWFFVSIRAWLENPLLGVGLNNFEEFYATNYQAKPMAMTHSAFLSFLAETGIVGFFLEMTVIALVVNYLFSAVRRAKEIRRFDFYYLLIGLSAAYMTMLGANLTYHFYSQFYVWFAGGLSVAASQFVMHLPTKSVLQGGR